MNCSGREGGGAAIPQGNMTEPWGVTLIANYAMVAHRHMHQYGTTSEQLARISVATRAHAMRNPQAVKMAPFARRLFEETDGRIPVGDEYFEHLWPEALRLLGDDDPKAAR